ncbi:MAG: carbohydrate ABC transporter permease, partial [Angelakisella sp.]
MVLPAVPHGGQRSKLRNSTADRTFHAVNFLLMLFIFLVYAWPMWFVIVASFSDPNLVTSGQVWLWPKGIHFGGYQLVFQNKDILTGYANSLFYTVVGTVINMVLTICAAYPLSRMDFIPRKFLTIMFIITMYFSGGLIPTFLQVRDLGLTNTPWAMIIPGAISIFNVLLLRSFFMYGIPQSLEEAAILDGANTLQMLVRIVLPLVKPTLAVLVLYYAVGHWN